MSSPGSSENGSRSQKSKRSPGSSFWASKRAKIESLEAVPQKEAEADCEVANLNEELYRKKTLKFRVTFIPRNQRGQNGYFRGADDTGERLFKAFAAEKHILSNIEFNQVYTLTDFKVHKAYFGKDYEIGLVSTSQLAKVDGCEDFPIPFHGKTLEDIARLEFGDTFDILGVVVGVVDTILNELRLQITDKTKEEALVRLYQEDKDMDFQLGDVLMIRHVKKGHDLGQVMSMSVHFLTHVWKNPPRDEVTDLKTWFKAEVEREEMDFPSSE